MCCSAVCKAKPQTPNTAWAQSVFAETAAPIITSHWPQNAEDIRICVKKTHIWGLNKRFGLYLCLFWRMYVLFVARSCDFESVFKLLSLKCVKGDCLLSIYVSHKGYHKNSPVLHSHFLMNKKTISHAKHGATLNSPCPWRELPFLPSLWVAGKRQIMSPDNENSFKLKVWTLMR